MVSFPDALFVALIPLQSEKTGEKGPFRYVTSPDKISKNESF